MTDTALPMRAGAAAVQLRVSGASYADIAETMGLESPRSAIRLVSNELAACAAEDDEIGDERSRLRAEESERLLVLLNGMMRRAADRTDPEQIAATRTAVQIIERRVKLHGLDAPTEITVHTPTQTELEQWVTAMTQQAMPKAALEEPDILDADVIEDSDDGAG